VKILLSIAIAIGYLGAAELIHVSNSVDSKSLEELYNKYKKEIVVSDSRAYLVPSECLLVRHFGGVSQSSVEVVGKELQNGYLSMTQELFEAKDVGVVKQEIEKQKISDAIEAKEAQAFLQESDGHLYAGISQGLVNLEEQKSVVKIIEQNNNIVDKNRANPTCKLLNGGIGYTILGASDAKIYNGSALVEVKEAVLFK
jgi:hypothetical protein